MLKQLVKLLIIFILFTINQSHALSNIWDLNTDTEYILENSTTSEITGGLGKLKVQLNHTGSILNGAGGALLNNPEGLFIEGNYAYISSAISDSIEILDISNPSNPTHVSSITNGDGGILLDDPRDIIKSGNYLYVAVNRSDRINVIDVTNINSPTYVTSINNGGLVELNGPRGLDLVGNLLYVSSYVDDAIEIIDISTPLSPTHVGKLRDTTRLNGAQSISVSGNYAYVTSDRNDSLEIIDISNPSTPTFAGQITNGTSGALLDGAYDVKINGNYAYVVSRVSDSLAVIDISTPTTPTHVKSISDDAIMELNGAHSLVIDGDFLYISSHDDDGVEVMDISDPVNPTHVVSITNSGAVELNGAAHLVKVGNYIYVSGRVDDGFEILELSYDSNKPYIISNNSLLYSGSVDKVTTTYGTLNEGDISYQISKDNGITWYYLNGTTRTSTALGYINSNSETEINSEIQSFNGLAGGDGNFVWKIFLNSDGTQKVEVDEIKIDYTSAGTNEIIDFETPGGYTVTNGIWSRQTTEFYEGTYSIESDNLGVDNTISCFEINRDIFVDSTIDFYRKVDSEAGYDFLRFYIDDVQLDEWAGTVARGSGSYDVVPGNKTFKWCYEKDGSVSNGQDKGWVDYIEIKELPAPPVEIVVLDFEIAGGYTLSTSVTAEDWFRQTTTVYEGTYALESANINDNQEVCVQRVQDVNATDTGISFYKKVSSEPGYDYLRFIIDGVEQNTWAGEVDWTKETYSLANGTYTLEWCYTKDGSVSGGSDTAWIDLVSVTQDPPIITEVTPVSTPTNDNTPDYTFNTPVAGTISYSGSCNSSSDITAVIGDNTITFDSLADGIYTDCTIQILASPENSTTLNISNFTIDTTGIDITINTPVDSSTIGNSDFTFDVDYFDADTGVNTGSIVVEMFKWNGSSYGTDISGTYISENSISGTNANYNVSTPGVGQYKIVFTIEDNIGNDSNANTVFNISSLDSTPPNITNIFPTNGILYPNSNFDISINYSDSESSINTSSIVMDIKKWNGLSYGADISGTYVTGSTISSTNATYNLSKLGYGKYKIDFYIEDSIGNGDTSSIEFYIDEPELIVSSGSIDIGNIEKGITKFSSGELNITVKTVGVGFDLILNKSPLLKGIVEISDWNGSNGIGYEKNPYTSTINLINTNEVIATQSGSININGDKNTYIYSIKLSALITEEQEAGEYNGLINFGIIVDY